MSGIYIPGVSMPKDGECIVVYGDGEVWHHGKRIAKVGTALEVPPHGRLGDLDAMMAFVDAGHLRNPLELSWSDADVASMIDSRPTIIPAEGGGADNG